MALFYRLAGFDHQTELLAVEFEIPHSESRHTRKIARIDQSRAIFADWPISRKQARALADIIGIEIDPDLYGWALESYTTSISSG